MKNKTPSILYISILLFVVVLEIVRICQSLETMDLGSGQDRSSWRLNSFSMTAQSNAEVVVFSAMCADVVVLYNGQNSKTV